MTTLLKHHYDKTLKDFKEGEVDDVDTGETFDIKDLFSLYKNSIKEMLDTANSFSSPNEKLRIKNIYEKEIKGLRIHELRSKLEQDTITLEEIEEWVSLMNRDDRKNFGIANYSQYVVINHAKPKPKNISRHDYSRFFELIYIMNYKNNISYKNSKPIKRKHLSELLEFSTVSGLDKFINKLKKNNMIIRTEPNHKEVSFLMINPAYAMRGIKINSTIYNYFKEDLDELLTPLEKKYIQLKGESENNPMLEIEN